MNITVTHCDRCDEHGRVWVWSNDLKVMSGYVKCSSCNGTKHIVTNDGVRQ